MAAFVYDRAAGAMTSRIGSPSKKDLSKRLRQVLPPVGGPTTISHTSEGIRQRPLSARDGDSTIDSDHTGVNTLHQILAGTAQDDSLFEKKKVHTVENALFEARGLLRREELFGTAIFRRLLIGGMGDDAFERGEDEPAQDDVLRLRAERILNAKRAEENVRPDFCRLAAGYAMYEERDAVEKEE